MRAKNDPIQPDGLLELIPDPDTVRAWLAQSIRRSAMLRSLLRLSRCKVGDDAVAPPTDESQRGAA